ncbi:MAG TPA: hypothetical protein VLH86_00285 [Patescibacteria group bacterium]|nr:hypothetical protein [Patescibacteria group bacterium]
MNLHAHERIIDTQVDNYMRSTSAWINDMQGRAADQLMANGNNAFRTADPQEIAHIAASMTREDMDVTMRQAVRQAEAMDKPPLIAVSANYPEDTPSDHPVLARNLDILRAVRDRYSDDLPISYFTEGFSSGSSIGLIRDGLFGGTMHHYRRISDARKQPMRDILCISWDADTVDATPTYWAQQRDAYRQTDKEVWMAYPNLRHDRLDPARFTHANSLLDWYDMRIFVARGSTPAHFAINLGAYALGSGFYGATVGEHAALMERAASRVSRNSVERHYLEQATAVVSNRRLAKHMAEGSKVDYGSLTSGGEHMLDTLEQDVSDEYAQRELAKMLPELFEVAFRDKMYQLRLRNFPGDVVGPALEFANRFIRHAARRIGNHFGTDDLVKEASEGFNRKHRYQPTAIGTEKISKVTGYESDQFTSVASVHAVRQEIAVATNLLAFDEGTLTLSGIAAARDYLAAALEGTANDRAINALQALHIGQEGLANALQLLQEARTSLEAYIANY